MTSLDSGDLAIKSPDGKALLRLTTYQFERELSLADLRAISENVRGDAAAHETRRGEFIGIAYELVDRKNQLSLQEHFLASADLMLFINVSTPLDSEHKHTAEIDAILDSLQDARI